MAVPLATDGAGHTRVLPQALRVRVIANRFPNVHTSLCCVRVIIFGKVLHNPLGIQRIVSQPLPECRIDHRTCLHDTVHDASTITLHLLIVTRLRTIPGRILLLMDIGPRGGYGDHHHKQDAHQGNQTTQHCLLNLKRTRPWVPDSPS